MTVTERKISQQSDAVAMKKRKHCEEEEEDEGSDTLHVVVRRVGKPENESLVLELDSDATVSDLKEKIVEALEEKDEIVIPAERQRLIFSGKMLRDESMSLGSDLNMKAGDDHKHFVHLTPLPKGAAPSVRTERELSENPSNPHEATLQRARARQRRRRRQEPRPGMSDPAAYHPYALDLASGALLPTASASSPTAAAAAAAAASLGLSSAASGEAALLSMAAAAQQSRLVQEVASHAALPDALQAVVLAQQQQQNLLSAAASGSSAAALLTNSAAALCPFGGVGPADSFSSLFAGRNGIPSAVLGLTQAPVAAMPAERDPTTALLQDLLARQTRSNNHNEMLPEILEQIAANAGELANTLRLLSPPAVASPPPAAVAPQSVSELARRLLLEERLASLTSQGSFLPGSLPGFF